MDNFVKFLEIAELYNSLTGKEGGQQRSDQLQALADLVAGPLFDWNDDEKRHHLALLESISPHLRKCILCRANLNDLLRVDLTIFGLFRCFSFADDFVSAPAFEAYVKIDDDDDEDCVQKKHEAFAALKESIAALPVDSLHDEDEDDDDDDNAESSKTSDSTPNDGDDDDDEDEAALKESIAALPVDSLHDEDEDDDDNAESSKTSDSTPNDGDDDDDEDEEDEINSTDSSILVDSVFAGVDTAQVDAHWEALPSSSDGGDDDDGGDT